MYEKENLISEESLSFKVVKGGGWVFSLRLIDRVFSIVRLIILAHLLSPNDFGLLGISLLAISILSIFTGTGFEAALIQKKENTKEYLNTAWTVQIIRGFILFCILFFIAPLVAKFFNAPKTYLIIKVLAFTQILGAFKNIGVIYFTKELEFNKKFLYSFISSLADIAVSIFLAFILRNVWALVWGLLAGNFASLFLSYLLSSYRPRIELNLNKIKELFGFGKWVLGSRILIFLITQGDDIFVGKLLGPIMLGFYQMAYRFSNAPATEITHVISQVTFPAYSKLQEDKERLKKAYLETLKITVFIAAPLATGIYFMAPYFTNLLLGRKWLPIVIPLQILTIYGFIRSIGATTGPVFQAVGKPHIATKLQFVKLIILAVTIYPLTKHWGITGASLAVVFNALLINPFADYFVIKIIQCKVSDFIKLILLPVLASILMVLFLLSFKIYMLSEANLVNFFSLITLGIGFYFLVMYILDKKLDFGLKNTIIKTLYSKKGV